MNENYDMGKYQSEYHDMEQNIKQSYMAKNTTEDSISSIIANTNKYQYDSNAYQTEPFGSSNAEEDKAETAKNPAHYKDVIPGYEYMDLMEHLLGFEGTVSHLQGQIYKYLMRYGKKDDNRQEAKKVAWYAARLEEVEDRKSKGEFPIKVYNNPDLNDEIPF
jgi:hypothetical protein